MVCGIGIVICVEMGEASPGWYFFHARTRPPSIHWIIKSAHFVNWVNIHFACVYIMRIWLLVVYCKGQYFYILHQLPCVPRRVRVYQPFPLGRHKSSETVTGESFCYFFTVDIYADINTQLFFSPACLRTEAEP